jgi:aspartyl-tRNA(Asn)/glutamyl-tRNA(Gln) amidotransferase subunit C
MTAMGTKISREEVRHVANLARLELTEQEELRMTEQMNTILSYMDKLNELDTRDVPATTHAIHQENVSRQDLVNASIDRGQALANAPQSDGVNFIVPKVV